MNKRSDKADEFLRAMQLDATETTSTPAPPRPADPAPAAPAQSQKPAKSRVDRKHIGGYLDRETVEKVAVLRAAIEPG